MLKEETIVHCHAMMDRLLDEVQDHVLILESPSLKEKDQRRVVEYLSSCLVLFDLELQGHVEAEEREMYPVLKQRLAVEYSLEMEGLYAEHRMLEGAITRLSFEISRALRSSEVSEFCDRIVELVREVVALFEAHSRSECQIFEWAGLAYAY